jgi:hypothetical protein
MHLRMLGFGMVFLREIRKCKCRDMWIGRGYVGLGQHRGKGMCAWDGKAAQGKEVMWKVLKN